MTYVVYHKSKLAFLHFERRILTLGKKLNEAFLAAYTELDGLCMNRFAVEREGVTEYINRLGALRKAYKKEIVLSHLVKYRRIKGDLESGSNLTEKIRRSDIAWLSGIRRDIEHNRDPIGLSERKSKRISDMLDHKILKIFLPILAAIVLCAAVVVLIITLANK